MSVVDYGREERSVCSSIPCYSELTVDVIWVFGFVYLMHCKCI